MKHMKKLLSLVLTLVTVFALSATAMADETYTITINNTTSDYKYEVYQIFDGDLDNRTLSNIVWGSGVNEAGKTALLRFGKGEGEAAYASASKLAEALNNDNAPAFADEVSKYLADSAGSATVAKDATTCEISGLDAGYYLIKNTAVPGENGAYTVFLMKIVGDAEATPKSALPEVEKKVKDTNDSTGATSDWQDSADHDIGDEIEFQLTGTLPSNYAEYETYKYIFHDTMTKLTYKVGSVKVMVGETDVTSSFTPTFDAATKKLTVSCDDLKAIKGVTIDKDSEIVVTYIATLDSDANIGATGNPNVVKLEFSNNPNYGGDGDTGFTPEDKVTVFTFKVIVNKTDGTNALTGAAFTLYKKNTDNVYVAVPQQVTITENGTKFEWKGLDDGDYKLSETTTPPGYNTAADIEFTITAEHEIESDNPQLTKLECNFKDFTIDLAAGSLTTTVVNKPGTLLPETGGIGTTIFYVLGGVMMAGAVVLMVTKRRMNAER